MKRSMTALLLVQEALWAAGRAVLLNRAWKLDWQGTQVRCSCGGVIALRQDTKPGETGIWPQKSSSHGQWRLPQPPQLRLPDPDSQDAVAR